MPDDHRFLLFFLSKIEHIEFANIHENLDKFGVKIEIFPRKFFMLFFHLCQYENQIFIQKNSSTILFCRESAHSLSTPFCKPIPEVLRQPEKRFRGNHFKFRVSLISPPVFHHFPGAGWSRRWITTETCKKYRVWRRHKEGVRWDEPGHVCQRCRLENRDSRGCFLWFSGGNMWPVKKFGDYIQQKTDWFIFVKNFAIDR